MVFSWLVGKDLMLHSLCQCHAIMVTIYHTNVHSWELVKWV